MRLSGRMYASHAEGPGSALAPKQTENTWEFKVRLDEAQSQCVCREPGMRCVQGQPGAPRTEAGKPASVPPLYSLPFL